MIHLADTYYRPSWQGGDIQRPLCHRGRPGFLAESAVSQDFVWVTCPDCIAVKRGEEPAPHPPRPLYLRPLAELVPMRRSMTEIATIVCERRGLTLEALVANPGTWESAEARHEAMWLMRSAGFRADQVARFLHRHPETVKAGCIRHGERLQAMQEAA